MVFLEGLLPEAGPRPEGLVGIVVGCGVGVVGRHPLPVVPESATAVLADPVLPEGRCNRPLVPRVGTVENYPLRQFPLDVAAPCFFWGGGGRGGGGYGRREGGGQDQGQQGHQREQTESLPRWPVRPVFQPHRE